MARRVSRATLAATALCAATILHASAAPQDAGGAVAPPRLLDENDAWTRPDEADPTTPAGQLREIKRLLVAGEYDRARALADAWLERHERDPLRAEALLARGDAKDGGGDEYQALFDYEAIATLYPGSEVFVTALEREFDIARRYVAGLRRKWLGLRFLRADDEAQELLIRIQERLPGSQLAEEAGMTLADFYFDRGEMTLAAEAYQLFIENYPRSPQIRRARLRLISARLASYKGPEFDSSGLIEAGLQLRTLEQIEPLTAQQVGSEAILLRIDESVGAQLLQQARWYSRIGDPIAAERTVRRLVERYPRTVAAQQGLDLGAKLVAKLPTWAQAGAPDYEGMRAGLVALPAAQAPGQAAEQDEAALPPATPPAEETEAGGAEPPPPPPDPALTPPPETGSGAGGTP